MRILIFTSAQNAHTLCADMQLDTHYTAEQLAKIGRAMERSGAASLSDFIARATMQRANSVLAAQHTEALKDK